MKRVSCDSGGGEETDKTSPLGSARRQWERRVEGSLKARQRKRRALYRATRKMQEYPAVGIQRRNMFDENRKSGRNSVSATFNPLINSLMDADGNMKMLTPVQSKLKSRVSYELLFLTSTCWSSGPEHYYVSVRQSVVYVCLSVTLTRRRARISFQPKQIELLKVGFRHSHLYCWIIRGRKRLCSSQTCN